MIYLLPDFRADLLAREVLEQLALGGILGRKTRCETRRARGVRVHVRLDIDSRRARRVDLGDDLRFLAPVARAGRLQVIDLARHATLFRDPYHLIDGFEN